MRRAIPLLILVALVAVGCTSAPAAPTPIPSPLINNNGTAVSQYHAKESPIKPGNYVPSNSDIPSTIVRKVRIDPGGNIWMGFDKGFGFYTGANWSSFHPEMGVVNGIAPHKGEIIWVGSDSPIVDNALYEVDYVTGRKTNFTSLLPNSEHRIYDIESTPLGVYVSTYSGVAFYDGKNWSLAYQAGKNIFNDHVHVTLHTFEANGKLLDIWVGHIDDGVSWYNHKEGDLGQNPWHHFVAKTSNISGAESVLGGDKIRAILELPDRKIVIGADGGGLSIFDPNGSGSAQWQYIGHNQGLPDSVLDLAVDHFNRIWVATGEGVFYQDHNAWRLFALPGDKPDSPRHYPAMSVAVGGACTGCPTDVDMVAVGTQGFGLIVGNLPPQ